ncbi:MAG: KEOPS complex subunit Pcc1 [Thermoplasmata archaeon]
MNEMIAECELEFEYDDELTAYAIAQSVKVDDYNYVSTKQIGNKIYAKMCSKSILGLLHTVEDYLSCLSTAERTLELCRKN